MARTPHLRYVRHRRFDRVRHSTRLLAWLDAQADRLGQTPEDVFNLLLAGNSAEQVEAMADGEAPANTVAPAITGTPTVGETLTCSTGTWTGNPTPTYTFQWKRGGTAISGATASTYLLVEDDATTTITCTVTATNSVGSADATSAGVGPIAAA